MSLKNAHAAEIMPDALRRTMVDSQLRTVGVMDGAVLAAMAACPRERFVPAALQGLAYADAALEVAPGRWLLEPMVLALLLQTARVTAADRVLVIGAATGYSVAVLERIGAAVTAIESDPALVAAAGAAGIGVIAAPLAGGWRAAAPYDLVLFEGAIETVPAAIAAQVAPGGRIAAVVRDGGAGRDGSTSRDGSAGRGWGRATVGPAVAGGRIGGQPFLEVAAKPLPGFALSREFAF